ncbi:MAG: triphosphoribosyl-dephospho-CoA synthase [Pseudomonadota bacterium]|nr:triphosphoribosyl-dephospho-CoA synthase [Pseudomonadota bacterium]
MVEADVPSFSPRRIEAAFLKACRAEIAAIKPGNVHIHAAGHGMDAATFERAALACAPVIVDPSLSVGARILQATRLSFSAAGCNANLGIVLLAAPLAKATQGVSEPRLDALRDGLRGVLATLSPDDAADAFAAIAHASPGGLGARADHDVREAPTIGLLEAMALAAETDRIARQFVSGFEDIFEIGLPACRIEPKSPFDHPDLGPAFKVYLSFAGGFADSHIIRKFGASTAETTRKRFADFVARITHLGDAESVRTAALAFDRDLKAEGLNPGTSADLTVATLFARFMLRSAT